jgi:hypothetical protein
MEEFYFKGLPDRGPIKSVFEVIGKAAYLGNEFSKI